MEATNIEDSQQSVSMAVIVMTEAENPDSGFQTIFTSFLVEQMSRQGGIPQGVLELLRDIGVDSAMNLFSFWEATGGRATLKTHDLQSFRR